MNRCAMTTKGGFSLLEVVLVLAILAIFTALAAPRYARASGRYRADLAARRVLGDLRLAQWYAKTVSASRTVSFSTTTDQYQLLSIPAPDGVSGDYTVALSAEPYRADLTNVSFSAGKVTFTGWGLPDQAGTVVLTVGGEQRTVAVDNVTGRICLQ